MAHVLAIANQKGGVGKTTTAVNLAASLAVADRRTLLLDADPQGNATSGVGIVKHELQLSLYDSLVEERPSRDVVLPVPSLTNLAVLPATQDLVGAELQLVERPHREAALRAVLDPLQDDFDYIVVDCPPSLGLLTLNVLAAATTVLIPIQCEYYGLEGISQLLNTVRLVQQNFNPGLAISGVLLTMYDARLNLCRQVAEDAKEYFGAKMFVTPIPRNVRLAEAPSFGKPILLYDVQSVGAKSYLSVAQELIRRLEPEPSNERSRAGIQPLEAAAARAAAGQAVAGEASSSDHGGSRDAAPAEARSEETSPHQVVSDQSLPDQAAPQQADSRAAESHAAESHEAVQDFSDSSNGTVSDELAAGRGSEADSEKSPVVVHAAQAAAPEAVASGDRPDQLGDANTAEPEARQSQSQDPEGAT